MTTDGVSLKGLQDALVARGAKLSSANYTSSDVADDGDRVRLECGLDASSDVNAARKMATAQRARDGR
ncbi:hypothetical protein O9X98_14535 [Agrobacterium salinitolerans]|nr:hypothetical protein [Agrobacterium salinitolerans]